LEHDTKLLYATAHDGNWDAFANDFVTKSPDDFDMILQRRCG
jgi:hypothetical protein